MCSALQYIGEEEEVIPDYEAIIQRVVDTIEERLDEEWTLPVLAQLAGFSEFHFHRVFQAIVGENVMGYVRNRRLARAASQIADSEERLLHIALNHGFSSQETFIRAFRRVYGMTPGQLRRQGIRPPLSLKANVMHHHHYMYSGGMTMEHQIVTKPAFDIIGYSIRTTNDGQNHQDIPAFWQRYMAQQQGKTLQPLAASNAEYGICDEFDMETGEFSYIIGVEAQEGATPPEGAIRRHYPEQTYAVFTTPAVPHEQFTTAIHQTWQAIFSEWFPESGYEHAAAAEFEYYDERCWSDRTDLPVIDIYIPVVRKA